MTEAAWRFVKIGLVVTGEGERDFISAFLRPIAATGKCHFPIILQTGQRHALTETKERAYNATGKIIPDRDAAIGAKIRHWLASDESHYAIWLDDLESASRPDAARKFERMRKAVDTMLSKSELLKPRFAVHFLVNMLEAYYFAHTSVVNAVNFQRDEVETPVYLQLQDHAGDCENLVHPKNELKRLVANIGRGFSFDETLDGTVIVHRLDLDRILGSPATCRSLRTLVAWCWETIGEPRAERFRLTDGVYWNATAGQLQVQPPQEYIGPLGDEEAFTPQRN